MTHRVPLLPRNSLIWMLLAQTLAMAPLLLQLPVWLAAVWSAVIIWRVMEFRGHWTMPTTATRLLLIVVCIAGLFLSFGRLIGMEPMVALLICAVLLKQLEVRKRRDAIVLVYLTWFLVAVQFLFNQSLLAGSYGLLCFWCNCIALLAIHQPSGHADPWRSARIGGSLLLHSLPLMLLLFLIMPRLGSLWAVPNPSHTATTGVSDSMAPGDIVNLLRSGGVAFRANFDAEVPPREQLYWRGLVFSRFDGRTWEQAEPFDYYRDGNPVNWQSQPRAPWRSLAKAEGDEVRYRVIMEASYQPWLYTLGLATDYRTSASVRLGFTRDFRLMSAEPVFQRFAYQLTSSMDYRLEPDELPDWRRRNETRLPAGFNPQSLQIARQWREQAASDDAYLRRVLGYFEEQFVYSLQPPGLGEHSVDDFLWRTREGFCEHFASSFVFMMRAAGIPARVVAGYLGGEYNQVDNYVVVHQYDAHAWAEVWFPQRGWVRVDPTLSVSPERIRQSLGESRPGEVEGAVSLGRYRHIYWIARLRLHWDAIQYRWDSAVLGFDSESQSRLLTRWLGEVSPLRIMWAVLLAGGGLLGLLSLRLWWQNRPPLRSAGRRFADKLERLLGATGNRREVGEPVGDYLRRAAARLPQARAPLLHALRLFESLSYRDAPIQARELQAALRGVRQSLRHRRKEKSRLE